MSLKLAWKNRPIARSDQKISKQLVPSRMELIGGCGSPIGTRNSVGRPGSDGDWLTSRAAAQPHRKAGGRKKNCVTRVKTEIITPTRVI